jgi:ribosome maturation factor RimP
VSQPNSSAGNRLAAVLAPVVQAAGLDLEAVEVVPAGRRRLVRVLVDRDGGVSLDEVTSASQAVSAVLDDDPAAQAVLGNSAYVLEVGSPGVDRPLTEPRHWRRARGRLVRLTLASGESLTGRLLDVTPVGISLAADGESSQARDLGFGEVRSGRVLVEFRRPDAADSVSFEVEESR